MWDSNMLMFKRFVFWVEVAGTFSVFVLGLFLTVRLLLTGSGDIVRSLLSLLVFSEYLLKIALESFIKVPSISILSVCCFSLYVWSLSYLVQSPMEKRTLMYVVPLSIAGILLCCIGIFGLIFSGLTSQGAGH
jgi:uncharacterized membrane protein